MQSGDKTIERVYNYLCDYISKNQISPSVRDICAGVGLKSTSSVHTYLKQLDSLGRIEYRPGLRRAIVIKQNSNSTEQDLSDSARFLLSVRSLPEFQSLLMRITLIHSLSGSPLSEILKHSCLKSAVTV